MTHKSPPIADPKTADLQAHRSTSPVVEQKKREEELKERYRQASKSASSKGVQSHLLDPSLKEQLDRALAHLLAQLPPCCTAPPLPLASPAALGATTALAPLVSSASVETLASSVISHIAQTLTEGKQEINVTLDLSASSTFAGSTLTITLEQYQTAPQALNITLLSNPQALQLLQTHLPLLLAALKTRQEEFKVHRLETALQTEESSEHPFLRKVKMDTGNHASA
jgi:hypothetical protein